MLAVPDLTATGSINVKLFGAKGDGVTDDTAAIQRGLDFIRLTSSKTKQLNFADGRYIISSPLVLTPYNAGGSNTAYTGFTFKGDAGRGGCVITQTADNQPIFSTSGTFVHSNVWENITGTWSTAASSSKTNRNFIKCNGVGDFYNNRIENVNVSNGHYVLNSDSGSMLVWGLQCINWFITDMSGGVIRQRGSAGQPNCRYESIYALCQTMVGPIFDFNAVECWMDNVELNQASLGPVLYSDVGGGLLAGGRFGLEAGLYAAGAATNIINTSNGKIRLTHFSFTATVERTISLIFCGSSSSPYASANITLISCRPTINGAGQVYIANVGGTLSNPDAANVGYFEVDDIALPNGWVAGVNLTNIGAAASADGVRVKRWTDPGGLIFFGDESTTLLQKTPRAVVFNTALTADRIVTLPSDVDLFSGRPFVISKTNSAGAGILTIKNSAGTTLETIAAASKGRVELVYNRSLQNGPNRAWTVVGKSTW